VHKSLINPFTASCENAMTLLVPGVPASCQKFTHSSQLNFWSTESIFNQFSVFLRTLNALCVCLQYKHPRSMERVIRSDKPVTLLLLFWSHKCDFGSERVKQKLSVYWRLHKVAVDSLDELLTEVVEVVAHSQHVLHSVHGHLCNVKNTHRISGLRWHYCLFWAVQGKVFIL
jgi:hypothetical protein